MNVYDTANKLAQEIKSSEEYKKYKEAKDKINADAELKKKIYIFEEDDTNEWYDVFEEDLEELKEEQIIVK